MNFPFREFFSRRAPARAEEKASRTGALVALFSSGRPRWTPRDYAALAREGYTKNPIAFRSVRMIAEAAANVPLLLYEGAREHDEHPLLALLSRPNPRQTGADLIEQLAGYLLVSGNAYLERVCVLDEVRELHALRPDRMKVIPGAEGWAEAYEYRVGGSAVRFAMSDTLAPILHLTIFNPLDDHYGMSPLEAAQASLDVHNAASAWNKALLDNAARPSGALVYSAAGGNLSDEQFERLKTELEAHYQGAANAGRPLLLEGGLDWKGLSLSPKDMDFVEAKHIAAREIALSFGVPPMLLGIPGDNTYSNYAEANRAFYRQTVVPLVTRIASALGHWLGESFGGALRLVPDLDEVPALSIEREALWKRVGEAGFLTDDEKREAAGYEPLAASSLSTLLAKYSPDQPRAPAGSSDGGQWTNGGGAGSSSGDEEGDEELLPDNALPVADIIFDGNPFVPDPKTNQTTIHLAEILSRVVDKIGVLPDTITARDYGTRVHTQFARAVRDERIPGIGFFDVESSWGIEPDARYGARLSVRTDVVFRNESGDIIAIYDVKTGTTPMPLSRKRELHEKTRTDDSVPIIILRVARLR
ncbi:MAG: phage portal protein [Xanthobacteraceae bacterium]|nr:phage portal protein [Xanthobacteraceae bacterium]